MRPLIEEGEGPECLHRPVFVCRLGQYENVGEAQIRYDHAEEYTWTPVASVNHPGEVFH